MAAIAFQVDQTRRLHVARNDLVRERKWQIVRGRSIHVDGMQDSVGTFHLQLFVRGHQQNVWLVAALFLIEKLPLQRQVHRFAA